MLNSEDHSGLITFFGGMVVLVFAGVGMSLAVDRRFESSDRRDALRTGIAAGGETLRDLELDLEIRMEELASRGDPVRVSSECDDFLERSGERMKEIVRLVERRTELEAALQEVEKEFSIYRGRHRSGERAAAAGEELDVLRVRSGRSYRNVRILRVTDVGIEIRHEHGIARLRAPELGAEWQDRFQWNDEEREAQLEKERRQLEAAGAGLAGNAGVPEGGERDMNLLRRKVRVWEEALSGLEKEFMFALDSSRRQVSVPESLETWRTRRERLSKRIALAKRELALVKARLRKAEADDLLEKEIP